MQDAETALREWVRSHQVTWERKPHLELVEGRMVHSGYDVTLFALHPLPLHEDPGCPECLRIHRSLRDLATTVIGDSRSAGGLAIAPFTPTLSMRAESNWAPEVELDVEVLQPGAVTASDADEDVCIQAMEKELLRLGARHGRWGR
jgi:hypothetical protein